GLALAIVMPVGGRLADRFPPAPMVSCGLAVVAASFVLTGSVEKRTAYAVVLGWILMGRIGIGVMAPALTLGSLRGLPQNYISQAASINVFVRQFGAAAGISIIGSVLHWRLMANGAKAGMATAPAEQSVP